MQAREMLKLDHISVIAPSLAEGVSHVRACLDLDVPFGQRHAYMGTYNHLLQLGDTVYLEIVALDPEADGPGRPRWFGLDDQKKVRSDWDEGRRLRGWVARTDAIDAIVAGHRGIFGEKVPFQRSIHLLISPFRTTALFLSTGRLPLSSTGAASLAQWPRLPI
jgi:Glyoxalase-like domain